MSWLKGDNLSLVSRRAHVIPEPLLNGLLLFRKRCWNWFCKVGFFNAAVAINIKSLPSFPSGSFRMFSLIFLSHWTVVCSTVLLLFVDLEVLCNDCKSNMENFAIKLSVGTFLTTVKKGGRHDHLAKKLIHLIEVSCQENRLYCHLKCLYLLYFIVTDSPVFIAL